MPRKRRACRQREGASNATSIHGVVVGTRSPWGAGDGTSASASASVTGFSINVVDLRWPGRGLDDGPAYTHYVHSNPENPGDSFSTFYETMRGDRSFGYADAASEARARTRGDALFADASIHAFDTRTGATTFTTVACC